MKKELDLTLLVDYDINDSAKAYLEIMYQNGYYPKKIIVLGFLQGNFITKYSRYIGEINSFRLLKSLNKLIQYKGYKERKAISKIITNFLNIKVDFFKRINLKRYTKDIDYLYIKSYKDEKFLSYIKKEETKTFLYASSGIVPKEFLELDNIKVLHIHPGIVPDIKGSDGFFWSIALRKKLGYSCFYMDCGIDTGDIIVTKEYDIPKIKFSCRYNSDILYKALLNYCDTLYRAELLILVFDKYSDDLSSIDTIKQDSDDGNTYFTMHNKLISQIIKKYFL
jgi:folate-dependent phosphoribosylglycinamide formyltransferase PurN